MNASGAAAGESGEPGLGAASSPAWDVVVIGGGMVGLAIAYHLTRRQARVLLLERGSLAGAASGANAGRAQSIEAHFGLNLSLVKRGHARLATLAEELGSDVEWRTMGNLVLIDKERHWQEWSERAERLSDEGIATEMLSLAQVRKLEPRLAVDGFLGAAHS